REHGQGDDSHPCGLAPVSTGSHRRFAVRDTRDPMAMLQAVRQLAAESALSDVLVKRATDTALDMWAEVADTDPDGYILVRSALNSAGIELIRVRLTTPDAAA